MPPCSGCGAAFAAHVDGRCPQTQATTDRVAAQQSAATMQDTGQLPQLRPTLPSPGRNKKKRLRVILAVLGAAIVVALGVSIYASKTSTAKTNAASICVTWESSQDGQVVEEAKGNGFCDTTHIIQPPQNGGDFSMDSAEPKHGSQVCSVSSVNGGLTSAYGSIDIIYQGTTGDSAEAENLCASMKSVADGGAAELQQDGALETGCEATYGNNGSGRVTVTLYNPGSVSVSVNQVGVQWISNGVLISTNSSPYQVVVAPGQVVTLPFSLGAAIPATTCAAGWEGTGGDAVTPPDPASSPVDSTSTETPAPAETETTPTAAATMNSTDYQGLYKEAYEETATDYQGGQTPAVYHESDSEFCKATIETSLGNEEPIYAGCMAALSAQQ
jgi:hypothetical protein